MEQKILTVDGQYDDLDVWIQKNHISNILLVCGQSITKHKINEYINRLPSRLGIRITRFTNFQQNPLYENIKDGVTLFRKEVCDSIIAIGGGSAIDTAKCIKLYSNMEGNGEGGLWLRTEIVPNSVPFLVMPTTAGSGSEATRFAVIYYEGEKQSVSNDSCIPETVIMDSNVLGTLSEYQKKSTMLDALCHGIESYWSMNSTEESRGYSRRAIKDVVKNMNGYLMNTNAGNKGMQIAAYMAGKAINITQTTAGHAMCYKITTLFGYSHGHAVALCDRVLYSWMLENVEKCCDPRGAAYLEKILDEIAQCLGCENALFGAEKLKQIVYKMGLEKPKANDEQYECLRRSVNPDRLKNHPIILDEETIDSLYHHILGDYK